METTRKTRSKGSLTEEELNATLPLTGKKSTKNKNSNLDGLVDETPSETGKRNEEGNIPVKLIRNPVTGDDGVLLSVNDVESRATDENRNKHHASSSEDSESDSTSSSSTRDSSSTSDDNRSYKRKKGGSAKTKRRKHKQRRTYDSDSSDEDSYHMRLLEQNPGLVKYLEKKEKGSTKKRAKRAWAEIKKKHKRGKTGMCRVSQSPSMVTEYAPALEKITTVNRSPQVDPVNKNVARGLKRLHIHNRSLSGRETDTSSSTSSDESQDEQAERERRIHQAAEDIILNSEKYKGAATALPEGIDKVALKPYNYNDDDNFMVSTCHVDIALHEKIQFGRFVAMNKLLNKSLKDKKDESEVKMEMINKDGQCYWAAKEKETKISGIRKWEQAFRVYMTIYSAANPSRAGEILSYADVISNAANTYTWDNIANYDFYFRKLMERHPHRSWARIHNQLWTLMMKDHLQYRTGAGSSTSS